jgi:hypothetical protein
MQGIVMHRQFPRWIIAYQAPRAGEQRARFRLVLVGLDGSFMSYYYQATCPPVSSFPLIRDCQRLVEVYLFCRGEAKMTACIIAFSTATRASRCQADREKDRDG